MTTFLNLFYQLPLEFIAQRFLIISLVYLWVFQHFEHCRWFRRGVWATLTAWIAAVVWITILSRTPGSAHIPELIPFHSYRKLLATGITEIIRTNFMNVALFYPAGLLTASLFPEKWTFRQKIWSTAILFAMFSGVIEYVQFFYALGEPEMDDVIHNTLGALLGTLPFIIKDILHSPVR